MRRHACGTTLVEVVLALVLLATGALALVAATSGGIRAATNADVNERATLAARDRVEHLAALACADIAAGHAVDSLRGLRERWVATPTQNGVRLVTDSVWSLRVPAAAPAVVHRLVVCR